MKLSKLLAATLAVTSTLPASAAVVKISSYSFTNGKETGTLRYAPSGFNNQSLYVGGFTLNGTDTTTGRAVSFDTFCVDVSTALTMPATYQVTSLTTLFNSATSARLATLVTNFKPTNATQSAALQLAIWETAFETGTTTDVKTGVFAMAGGSSGAARTLANSYLTQAAGLSQARNTRVQLLFSSKTQSQIFASAAPEPTSWAMLIFGFGAIGGAARRSGRKSRAYLA